MTKFWIFLLSMLFSINLVHAVLTVTNENIPLDKLSPPHGMMGSNKNSPALFDLPAEKNTKTYNLAGNFFDFMVMPHGKDGVRCFLNKNDKKETPYAQRQGLDIPENKNTKIVIRWVEGQDQLQCQVAQEAK